MLDAAGGGWISISPVFNLGSWEFAVALAKEPAVCLDLEAGDIW